MELLAIDGLAASTVAAREVTTLEHELRDDAMELRLRIAKTVRAGSELAEVLCGLWDDIVKEFEDKPA